MGVIQVLPAAVADQIAAGEVVERPASVIKELIENALDAGATRLEVDVVGGGLERMVVQDNGGGMADDDAVLCFSRHATSKLRAADDLLRIGTFGFRGEALAAISSVARVVLTTRRAGASEGFQVNVDGGRVLDVGAAGALPGTRVEVQDLFFNVPARRKFLKTARTESAHIEEALLDVGLCRPDVAVKLVVDGKIVLDLPAVAAPAPGADVDANDDPLRSPARLDRVVRCLGKHLRPYLYPFSGQTDLMTVRGHIVAPLETRRDLHGVHLSVNGRPVSDRQLVQAVRAAFRTLLEVGRQPIVALDIALDPALVDVNVHPRKAEVRFSDPRRVSGHLIALLSQFLATTPWLQHQPKPAQTFRLQEGAGATLSTAHSTTTTGTDDGSADGADHAKNRIKEALARFADRQRSQPPSPTHPPMPVGPAASATTTTAMTTTTTTMASFSSLRSAPGRGGAAAFSALRVVGQVGGTYLVLEGPEGMVVIDQHAAHERVVFERLRARHTDGDARSQPLLLPITIELSARERAALDDDDVLAHLHRFGLEVEGYAQHTALVRALPPGLDGKKALTIVRDALHELGSSGTAQTLEDRVDAVCARLACHAAIRAGDSMAPAQVMALLRDLDAIDLGAHCPHGRPVVRSVGYGELAGWFDRD